MATPISIVCFLFRFLVYASLIFLKKGYGFEGREFTEDHHVHPTHHTLHTTSLTPSTVCSPSPKVAGKSSYLEVVHIHGPCSKLSENKADSPSHAQILAQDESRVASIQAKLAKNPAAGSSFEGSKSTTLPTKSGKAMGTGNYIVTIGLGTPKRTLTFLFDTGSDLTWTQCEPCLRSCYRQQEPIFNPSLSSSYTNISCNSLACDELTSATGNSLSCSSTTCVYGIKYGDESFSVGFFAKEKLTLTPVDVFNDFLFGCGQNNRGLFRGTAGLLGLGSHALSMVSQTAEKYGKIFSYCLPSTDSSTGHLTFGRDSRASRNVKFTPLADSHGSSLYFLDMIGISVGGLKLSIPRSVFSNAGTVIDSGTVISRLPPTAYSRFKTIFKKLMSDYPEADPVSLLDTCYDFSGYETVSVPKISLFFAGGVELEVHVTGILYVISLSRVCLAFAGNVDAGDVGILGNTQQKTLDVVYDVAGRRVGFAPGGC